MTGVILAVCYFLVGIILACKLTPDGGGDVRHQMNMFLITMVCWPTFLFVEACLMLIDWWEEQ